MLGATGAALTLAAVMTSPRSIFVAPFDMRDQADEARRHLAVAYSDHLTGVAAFDEWRQQKKSRNEFRWARANFCGGQTLKAIDQSSGVSAAAKSNSTSSCLASSVRPKFASATVRA